MSIYALGRSLPDIASDAGFIAPNATIIGNVRVARGASVWFGAVIRGDNELIDIGEGTNIQDNAVLHTDPSFPLSIGEGCTIGHLACLHGCAIGDGSLIGMGAVVLNGGQIGDNCLIGARALLTEGMIVPSRSLVVGAPAKIVRALSEEQIADLRHSAEIYRQRSQCFSSQMAERKRQIDFMPA